MIMKKLTTTNTIAVLNKVYEEGYLSTGVFCRLLAELGLLRRYAEENYNNLIHEDEVEGILQGEQYFEHFPASSGELDALEAQFEA